MIEITKELMGDHLVLTVKCPPLEDKKISVLAEAIFDGVTTLDEQLELATEDAERRLNIYNAMQALL